MKEKDLKYVMIYWDSKEIDGEWTLVPYLRLIPGWLDLEEYGFPHGLSLGWNGAGQKKKF